MVSWRGDLLGGFLPFCNSVWACRRPQGSHFDLWPNNSMNSLYVGQRTGVNECLPKSIKIAAYSGDWPPSVSLAQEQTFFFCFEVSWVPSGWLKIVLLSGKINVLGIPKLKKQVANCEFQGVSLVVYICTKTILHLSLKKRNMRNLPLRAFSFFLAAT